MGMWEWDIVSNRHEWNEKQYELLGLSHYNHVPMRRILMLHLRWV